jgi:hypothetical protein
MISEIYVHIILHIIVALTSTVIFVHGDVDELSSLYDAGSDSEKESHLHVDGSWPMQLPHKAIDTTEQYPLYNQYMKGCYDAYNVKLCDENEAIRMERNTNQPKWVPRNYTAAGYAKVPAPIVVYTTLRDFWDRFSPKYLRPEVWDVANIYTNHWAAPTELLLLDPNPPLPPLDGTTHLPQMSIQNRQKIVEQVQDVLERWTGISLQPTSLYGIRSYSNGSILAPHVDRYVRSCV